MKKTKLTRSLLAACSIVALSAVMYGCAHTDSGPSQDELDAANAATAAAAAEAKANADAAAAAEADAAAAVAEAAAAAEAQAAAETAAAVAAALEAEAEAEAAAAALAQAEAEAAAAAADEARIEAEAAAAAADEARIEAEEEAAAAAADRMTAEEEAQDLEDEADADDAAAAKAMAEALYGGLFQPIVDAENDDAVDGDTGAIIARGTTGVTVERYEVADADIIPNAVTAMVGDPAAPVTSTPEITAERGQPVKVAITIEDRHDTDETTALSPAFAVAEEGMADEIEGWSGTLLERATPGIKDVMTVYTNIDSTGGVPFGELYMLIRGSYTLHDSSTPGAPDGKIDAAAFTLANFVAHANNAHNPDPAGTDPDPDYVAHIGTYQGANGVYQCTAAPADTAGACTSRINNDGKIVLGGASSIWTFTPNAGELAMVADSVYVHFGWWLRENLSPVARTGALQAEMVYGSSGSVYNPVVGAGADSAFNAVTGTVTYEGAAAGKYALVDGLNDTAEGGHWTADASLTAKFGSTTAAGGADTSGGTISGEITNFMTGDMERDWMVALLSTSMTESTTGPHFDTEALGEVSPDHSDYVARRHAGTTWSMGDDRTGGADGNWSGTFYVGDDDRNDDTPDGAAGEFSATFGSVGAMVGAFGVTNTTDDTTP